jgi:hypothetical protein
MVMVKNNGLMVMMMMQKRKRRREMVTLKVTKTPMGELQISSNLTSVTASDLRQGVKLMTQDEKRMGPFPPNCTCNSIYDVQTRIRIMLQHSMCNVIAAHLSTSSSIVANGGRFEWVKLGRVIALQGVMRTCDVWRATQT